MGNFELNILVILEISHHSSGIASFVVVVEASRSSPSSIMYALSWSYIYPGSLSPQYIDIWRAYCFPFYSTNVGKWANSKFL